MNFEKADRFRHDMKLARLVVFSVVLLFLNSAPSWGQLKFQEEQSLGLSNVLQLTAVKDELGLTHDQYDAVGYLWISVKDKLEKHFKNYRMHYTPKLSDEEKQRLQDELVENIQAVRDEEIARIEKALSPDQIKRLEQIRYQYLRRKSNGMKSLADDLGLSDQQLDEMQDVAKNVSIEFEKASKTGSAPGYFHGAAPGKGCGTKGGSTKRAPGCPHFRSTPKTGES